MAGDSSDSSDGGERGEGGGRGPASHGPRECMACRGSGQVISNLGGAPSTLTCPWCGGAGARVPGIDAQARWLAHPEGHRQAGEGAAGAAPEPAG